MRRDASMTDPKGPGTGGWPPPAAKVVLRVVAVAATGAAAAAAFTGHAEMAGILATGAAIIGVADISTGT
jgi:hypothetical protein